MRLSDATEGRHVGLLNSWHSLGFKFREFDPKRRKMSVKGFFPTSKYNKDKKPRTLPDQPRNLGKTDTGFWAAGWHACSVLDVQLTVRQSGRTVDSRHSRSTPWRWCWSAPCWHAGCTGYAYQTHLEGKVGAFYYYGDNKIILKLGTLRNTSN